MHSAEPPFVGWKLIFFDDNDVGVLKVSRGMQPFVVFVQLLEIFLFLTETKLLIKGPETLPAVQDGRCALLNLRLQN